jgi:hypothetical protein
VTKSPGLGESKKDDNVLTKEQYPLPDSRKGIIDAIVDILSRGGVQKLVVEVKKPIEAFRLVSKAELNAPQEIPPDELMLAVRNAPMQDFNFKTELPATDHLFRAFAWVSSKGYRPRALMAHSEEELRAWFDVDEMFPLDEVFGVETKIDAGIPEQTAVLVAVSPGMQDHVATSLRISMNINTRT